MNCNLPGNRKVLKKCENTCMLYSAHFIWFSPTVWALKMDTSIQWGSRENISGTQINNHR